MDYSLLIAYLRQKQYITDLEKDPTHSGILTRIQSTAASAATSPRIRRSPTTHCCILSFGYTLSPVTFSAQSHSTSELLRTLLMCGCF